MLLVDAYNALHVTGVLPPDLAGLDVRGLADLVARSRWRSHAAVLVCDGPGPGGPLRFTPIEGVPLEIRYAGPGRDADTLIETLLDRDTAPRRVLVVSSDHRLRQAARRRKAKWMPSDAFLLRLALDAQRPGPRPDPYQAFDRAVPLDERSVEAWLRAFRVSERDRARPKADSPRSPRPRTPPAPTGRDEAREPPAPPDDAALLREAMREWPGRIDPDDLDMRRWLDGPDFRPDAASP